MSALTGLEPGDGEANVADHVRLEREARGWSTAELARRVTAAGCPMSQSAVWRIESGEPRRKITVDELIGFSKVFGVAFERLLKPISSEFPRDLIRLYVDRWIRAERAQWDAGLRVTYAHSDVAEIVASCPGSAPHLPELVDQMLEESQLTFLGGSMHRQLESLPRIIGSPRRGLLFYPNALVDYWQKEGLSEAQMADRAEEWGLTSLAQTLRS